MELFRVGYDGKDSPDVLPQCEMGEYIRESTFMRLIGHQDVIAYLESEFNAQQEEIKEDTE